MTNPISALLAWRRRADDARLTRDQAQATVGLSGDAECMQRRAELQSLMDSRGAVVPDDVLGQLRDDPLIVSDSSKTALRQAMVALARDPAVEAIGRAGLRFRGALRPHAAGTGNSFIDQLQIMATAQSLELCDLDGRADGAYALHFMDGRHGAQVALTHDLLPAHQRADFLDTLAVVVVFIDKMERETIAAACRARRSP